MRRPAAKRSTAAALVGAAALAAAAATPGCATVDDCVSGSCSADAQVSAGVRALLGAHAALGPPGSISVRTVDGTVYLYGLVDTVMEQRLATSIAMQAPGAARVVNLVGVSNGR